MKPTIRFVRLLLAAALAASASAPAWAIYKIVAPDGSVTFSDVPPSSTQGKKVETLNAHGAAQAAEANDLAALPTALRQAVRKYPVTLYTTPQCDACDAARDFLQQRGVPFSEKTVTTNADIQAYKAQSGGSDRLPLLTIGSTRLPPGFSSSNWATALDAAGYPKSSELPRGYVRPAPTPLAPPSAPRHDTAHNPASAPAQPSVLPPPNPNAPKGFQF